MTDTYRELRTFSTEQPLTDEQWDQIASDVEEAWAAALADHRPPKAMQVALEAIAAKLDGSEWSAEHLEAIADIMRGAGYPIRSQEEAYEATAAQVVRLRDALGVVVKRSQGHMSEHFEDSIRSAMGFLDEALDEPRER